MKSVICGLGALLVAWPCCVAAQDLGALAAKERERRKEQAKTHPTPARVVTDDDMSNAAWKRQVDSGETSDSEDTSDSGATARGASQPATTAAPSIEEAAEKLREVLAEDRRAKLAESLRHELRYADDAVRSAEAALREAKDRHDKAPMITSGESPFAARHRAEAYVERAERALDAAKERVRAIEHRALDSGIDPDSLH